MKRFGYCSVISYAFLGVTAVLRTGGVPAREVEQDVGKELPVIEYPILVGAERQLFVDDAVVESMTGVARTLRPATKYPRNPILVPEKPWETQAKSLLPLSLHRLPETGRLRVWYSAWGKQVNKPTYMCVADSTDGLHWTRPSLGLVEFEGSKDNNIIREGRMFRVLYDAESRDPAQRYKAIIRDAGFFAAFSPDGLRWNTTIPVLQKAFDATSVHWDPVGRKWIASCKQMQGKKRVRGYSESTDFLHWSEIAFMLAADENDRPADQLYSMSITRYESVYVGLLKVYDVAADRCDVQVAFSRDAKHWERPDRRPILPNGSKRGDWDYGNIDNPERPIRMGDELWFFYSGRSTLHNESPNDGAMGLAKLRLDGFRSVDAAGEEGMLTTRPLVLRGKSLLINADATGGQMEIEVLRGSSDVRTAIEPFTKANCVPITTDSICHPIKWTGAGGLESLSGKPVRLRFYLKNAKLYSFWTE